MVAQAQILNKILNTKDFSIITENGITADYFPDYKAEFNYIKNHYDTYNVVPDLLTFLNIYPNFATTEVREPDSYLVNELVRDYNVGKGAAAFNLYKDLVESGRPEEALRVLKESVENIQVSNTFTCTNLLTDKSRYDHYLEKTEDPKKYYFSTGFKELDDLIGGIDKENENMVIVARTGIGKSWTLIKMAVAASAQGKRVGIFSGEMTTDKVGYRVDTLLGHINNKDIMRGNLYSQRAYKQYIDGLNERGLGEIFVLTPADLAGPATAATMQAFIEKYNLEILFIDQYSLLEDTSHAKASWERVGNISKAIKTLQVKKKIPIISVAQMNRSKNEDGTKDTTQIGLADRIGQDATVVLMLDKTDEKAPDGEQTGYYLFEIDPVKVRDGGEGKKLKYRADFNLGTFEYINEDERMSKEAVQSAIAAYEDPIDKPGNPF